MRILNRILFALLLAHAPALGTVNFLSTKIHDDADGAGPARLVDGVVVYQSSSSQTAPLVIDRAGCREEVLSNSDPHTGLPTSWGTIVEYQHDGGRFVAFRVSGPGASGKAIYRIENGLVSTVVVNTDQAPGMPAGTTLVDLFSMSLGLNGEIAFAAGLRDDFSSRVGVYLHRDGFVSRVVDTQMSIGGYGKVVGIDRAALDGRDVICGLTFDSAPNDIRLFRFRDGQAIDLLAGTTYPELLSSWVCQDGSLGMDILRGVRFMRDGAIIPAAGPITLIDGTPYKYNLFGIFGVTAQSVLYYGDYTTPLFNVEPGFHPPYVVRSRKSKAARSLWTQIPSDKNLVVEWRNGTIQKVALDGGILHASDVYSFDYPFIDSCWGHSFTYRLRTGCYRADEVGWQPRPVPADYDGDGFEDIVLFEPASGHWVMRLTGDGTTVRQFGYEGATQAPADYDGDGLTDLAVYDPATGGYYANRSTAGHLAANLGLGNGVPVPADYDGDGAAEMAVYQASSGFWHVRASDGTISTRQLGFAGAQAVPGDYDGDGQDDNAVYESATGNWYIMASGSGFEVRNFGFANAVPVPGNYDGDAATELAVYEPATGTWYVQFSPSDVRLTQFGSSASTPLPGDHDGDGVEDIAVYFPYDRSWYVLGSTVGFIQK